MRVEVTQAHIDNGIRQDPCECPIALALKEQHPLDADHQWAVYDEPFCGGIVREEKEIDENGNDEWYRDNSYKRIEPSPEVIAFLNAFDDGRHVDPFVMMIEYPEDENHGVARYES